MTGASAGKLKLVLVLSGLALLGIAFVRLFVTHPINDLKLLAVRRSPASAMPDSSDLKAALTRRGEAVWRVSLEGTAEWVEEVRSKQLHGYPMAVRCDNRDLGVFALGPYVGSVPISYGGDGFSAYHPSPSGTLRYDLYIPEIGTYRSQADFNARMPAYDARHERMDLCVTIVGGGMQGAYGRSNDVRVVLDGTR